MIKHSCCLHITFVLNIYLYFHTFHLSIFIFNTHFSSLVMQFHWNSPRKFILWFIRLISVPRVNSASQPLTCLSITPVRNRDNLLPYLIRVVRHASTPAVSRCAGRSRASAVPHPMIGRPFECWSIGRHYSSDFPRSQSLGRWLLTNNTRDMIISCRCGSGQPDKLPDWTSVVLLLIVFSSGCYLNSLSGDFVHDDLVAVTGNPDVIGSNPVWDLLKNDFWGKPMADPASHKSYRPLTVLTFR